MLKIIPHKLPRVGEMIFSQIIVMGSKARINWIKSSFKNVLTKEFIATEIISAT